MIKFIICDDEKLFRNNVRQTINKIFIKNDLEYTIDEFEKYNKDFQKVINDGISNKIYILDIEIKNGISGIDIAKKIRKNDWNSIIIIVTSHSDLGFEALKAQIMLLDFISKFDNCQNNLEKIIIKAMKQINNKKVLVFKSNGIDYRIFLDDIIYIVKDSIERKCSIKTTYNEIAVNKSLSELIEKLDDRFYLTHRSCVINTEKIMSIDWKNNIIKFNNGEAIDLIARDRRKGLKKYVSMD